MIAGIYLATNAAMLQNVFAQVGQSPIYKGNAGSVTFLLSAQDGLEPALTSAQAAKDNGLVVTLAVTAEQMEQNAEKLKKISAMGHEIILQGEIDTKQADKEQVRSALNKEISAYQTLCGKAPRYYLPYRQQATAEIKNACKEQAVNVVLFSQDGRAVVHKDAASFAAALFDQIGRGDCVYLEAGVMDSEAWAALSAQLAQSQWKNQNISQALID